MDVLIGKISKLIGDVGQLDSIKREVMSFGLYYLVMFLFTIIGIIVVSSLMNTVLLAVIAAITAAVFRNFSGGAHFSKPEICTIVSSLIYPIAGLISRNIGESFWLPIIVISGVSALTTSLKLAPVEVPEKPISLEQRRVLRRYSIYLTVLWIGLVLLVGPNPIVISSCFGLLWQSLSMTPVGFHIHHLLDHCLLTIIRRIKERL